MSIPHHISSLNLRRLIYLVHCVVVALAQSLGIWLPSPLRLREKDVKKNKVNFRMGWQLCWTQERLLNEVTVREHLPKKNVFFRALPE